MLFTLMPDSLFYLLVKIFQGRIRLGLQNQLTQLDSKGRYYKEEEFKLRISAVVHHCPAVARLEALPGRVQRPLSELLGRKFRFWRDIGLDGC